jgi:hypothetical protein
VFLPVLVLLSFPLGRFATLFVCALKRSKSVLASVGWTLAFNDMSDTEVKQVQAAPEQTSEEQAPEDAAGAEDAAEAQPQPGTSKDNP